VTVQRHAGWTPAHAQDGAVAQTGGGVGQGYVLPGWRAGAITARRFFSQRLRAPRLPLAGLLRLQQRALQGVDALGLLLGLALQQHAPLEARHCCFQGLQVRLQGHQAGVPRNQLGAQLHHLALLRVGTTGQLRRVAGAALPDLAKLARQRGVLVQQRLKAGQIHALRHAHLVLQHVHLAQHLALQFGRAAWMRQGGPERARQILTS
jgi:hypothetical protein